MENLTKETPASLVSYVLGVAAKSNVDQRKVGCIIFDAANNKIVGEGHNYAYPACDQPMPDEHAETAALAHARSKVLPKAEDMDLVAYVTHQPCPACAKELLEFGIKEVKVVEAFMKFDGDKPRFDLIDPQFALLLMDYKSSGVSFESVNSHTMVKALYSWTLAYSPESEADSWRTLLANVLPLYADFEDVELGLARVLTFGARKYKPGNWKECSDTGRYLSAAHRHAKQLGTNDDETGLPHRDHLMCNLMFLFHLGLK